MHKSKIQTNWINCWDSSKIEKLNPFSQYIAQYRADIELLMLQLLIISWHLELKCSVQWSKSQTNPINYLYVPICCNIEGILIWVALFSDQLTCSMPEFEQYNFAQYRGDIDLLMLQLLIIQSHDIWVKNTHIDPISTNLLES